MNKIKDTIKHIDKLEEEAASLRYFLSIENVQGMNIVLWGSSAGNSREKHLHVPELVDDVKLIVQRKLDIIEAELNPLKERLRLISELL